MKTTTLNDNQARYADLLPKLLLFVFSPFLAFLYSLKKPASRSSYVIYFLFGVIFCWNMDSRGSARYDDFIGTVEAYKGFNFTTQQIVEMLINTFTFAEDSEKEIFDRVLAWFTKSICDNYHLFFALASMFYLTFMLKSLKFITNDTNFKAGWAGLLLMGLFVLPRDIITVQNPRFTCGFWYCVMCTFYFFNTRGITKFKWASLVVLSPLFHFALWLYVGLFFLCNLVTRLVKTEKLYLYLFYVSIPFSFLSYEIFSGFDFSILPLPDSMLASINSYMSDEAYERLVSHEGRAGFWWVQAIFTSLTTLAYSIMPIIFLRKKERIKDNKNLLAFFSYYLLFSSIVNFIQTVPELGARYYFFFRVFSIYFWVRIMFPQNMKYLKFVAFACSFYVFMRYFYSGAVSVCVPPDIWWQPLPALIIDGFN